MILLSPYLSNHEHVLSVTTAFPQRNTDVTDPHKEGQWPRQHDKCATIVRHPELQTMNITRFFVQYNSNMGKCLFSCDFVDCNTFRHTWITYIVQYLHTPNGHSHWPIHSRLHYFRQRSLKIERFR